MTDDQKQRVASISRQVAAGLASLYGILTLSGVTAHEPTWFTAVLVALGPAFALLEHSTLSPGGPPPPAPPPLPATPTLQMTHTVTEGTPIAPLPTPAPSSPNIAAGAPPSPIRPV